MFNKTEKYYFTDGQIMMYVYLLWQLGENQI